MRRERRGVILAGGSGTRLRPITYVLNKHLLPVFDRPMVMHPLDTLKGMGVNRVCIVTGRKDLGDFTRLFGNGRSLGVPITYRTQTGPKGLADALLKAEAFFGKEKVIAILGDDIFKKIGFPKSALNDSFAYVFVAKAENPGMVATVVLGRNGELVRIEEKSKSPKSDLMVVGLYIYPNDVFKAIRTLKPSERGELEITDLNNWYLARGRLKVIKTDSFVLDAGTPESLLRAGMMRARTLGIKIEGL